MNERLGAQHISALFALMGAARGISNNELEELAGFRIDGRLRRTLNERHLVTSTRQGNKPFIHELTDAGWKRCEAELAGEHPDGSGHLGGAFYMVLDGLGRFLRRENLILTDVFQPDADDRYATSPPPRITMCRSRPGAGAGTEADCGWPPSRSPEVTVDQAQAQAPQNDPQDRSYSHPHG